MEAATLDVRPGPVPIFSFAQMHADMDVAASIERVLDRGHYVLGPELQAFEHAFADFCGTDDRVGVANGTDALELALRALGVERDDRVAVVANAGGSRRADHRGLCPEPRRTLG